MDEREVRGGSVDTDPGLQQANALLPVQLVPTRRGGFKAKYGGFTFNMETSKGSRRHWHCDVRGCKSRLTTGRVRRGSRSVQAYGAQRRRSPTGGRRKETTA
ncbi:hypothetical protein MTO96_024992 [Rhipicephalus appendiculatus]